MSPRNKRTAEKPQAGERSLADRIVNAPRPSVEKTGAAHLADWLSDIARDAAGKTLAQLLKSHPAVEALIVGLAEESPYLWDLAHADPERLAVILRADPDAHFAALLERTAQAMAVTQDQDEAMRLLRRMKAEASLLIALSDIGGVWPVMKVTGALTELADMALRAAVNFLLADAVRRGRLKPEDPAHPEKGSGYIVLAMGKMGAFELNYSSDIDLIVFFDPEAPATRKRYRSGFVLCARDAGAGEDAAGAHGGRLCLPRRSSSASRSRLHADRGLDSGRARLLRKPRSELGACRDDQGACLRRRYRCW